MEKITIETYKIFVDEKGNFGNPVGIIQADRLNLSNEQRTKISASTGFSEVVYIDNTQRRTVSIYNPQEEITFSGHAAIGLSYFLHNVLRLPADNFNCKLGLVTYLIENDIYWVSVDNQNLPPWNLKELNSSDKVESINIADTSNLEHTLFWAWMPDHLSIRARTFAPDWGIPEDEANGSGAMKLTLLLQQDLEITHGQGSVVFTKFGSEDQTSVGGRVKPSGNSSFRFSFVDSESII
jgi:predicted PhzF superfamily epimerase YddE/YHI9